MPNAKTDDGVNLYYEETGSGTPVIFVHEFAGDFSSWELQVRHFCKRYRVITYNARGYPPSGVPRDVSAYSQNRAVADIKSVLDHLRIDRAHGGRAQQTPPEAVGPGRRPLRTGRIVTWSA